MSRSSFRFSFGCGYYDARDIIRDILHKEGYREKFMMSGESVWEKTGVPLGDVGYLKATYNDSSVNIIAWVIKGGIISRGQELEISESRSTVGSALSGTVKKIESALGRTVSEQKSTR